MSHEAPKQPNVSRDNHESSMEEPGSDVKLSSVENTPSMPFSVDTTSVDVRSISARPAQALNGPSVQLSPATPDSIDDEQSEKHPSTGLIEDHAEPTKTGKIQQDNARIASSLHGQTTKTLSSENSLKQALLLCGQAALKHASGWLRPLIVNYLPYLGGVLLFVIIVASALALFFSAINLTGHYALQVCCSNGLSSFTQFGPSIPLVGFRDICVTQATPTANSSFLDEDPTGISTILKWKDPSENLLATRRDMIELVTEARTMVYDTSVWLSEFPDAPTAISLHFLAVHYSSSQWNATNGIIELIERHRAFMESIAGSVEHLSDCLERIIADYSHTSFVLSNLWLSNTPGLYRFSPLGRVKHDFTVFVKHHLSAVKGLKHHTDDLIAIVYETETARMQLAGAFKKEHGVYAKNCLTQSTWWSSAKVSGTDQSCYLWYPDEVRQLLQQDSTSTLAAAMVLLKTSQDSYRQLQDRYNGVLNKLNGGNQRKEALETTDLKTFRKFYKQLSMQILQASASLEEAKKSKGWIFGR